MINLLDRDKRYFIRREYFGRLTNILLATLIAALVYYLVLIFANGILLNFEKDTAKSELDALSSSAIQKELSEYESTTAHLQQEYALFSKITLYPSEIIGFINGKVSRGITISAINITKNSDGTSADVEIRGNAKTRENLLNFVDSLEVGGVLESVSTPFSSLTRNADIPFSVKGTAIISPKE